MKKITVNLNYIPVSEGKRGVIYLQCGVKQFIIPWYIFWLSLSSARTARIPFVFCFFSHFSEAEQQIQQLK